MKMNTGCHTKRTEEFEKEIEKLIGFLIGIKKGNKFDDLHDKIDRICVILSTNTTDSGCVIKAGLSEPIFTLRGQDKLAPALVMAWAQLHDEALAEADENPRFDAPYRGSPRSDDAMECARQMARYHTRKYPV